MKKPHSHSEICGFFLTSLDVLKRVLVEAAGIEPSEISLYESTSYITFTMPCGAWLCSNFADLLWYLMGFTCAVQC